MANPPVPHRPVLGAVAPEALDAVGEVAGVAPLDEPVLAVAHAEEAP